MFIPAITTESGYILALGAVFSDGSKWVRWFCPGVINCKKYPRVISYTARKDARAHARNVLRSGKSSGVFPVDAKSIVIEVM